MQKVIIFIIIICFNLTLAGERPQKVRRIVYEMKPNEWYKAQADLWKGELKKNPQNPNAWVNYYNANRYHHFENIDTGKKKALLAKIITDMQAAIPGTFESYMLTARHENDINDISMAQKAYALRPDDPSTYDLFITHYEIHGNVDKSKEFYKKLYDSRDIAPWLLDYNYNMLMSAEKDAILFTNGDNDTYPARTLQEVHGVRTDVTVINISMSTVYSYLKRKLAQKDVKMKEFSRQAVKNGTFSLAEYMRLLVDQLVRDHPHVPINFALTVYSQYNEKWKDQLYVVGLATQYSKEKLDNIALLKRNERHFRLDNLSFNWYRENITGRNLRANMNMNYVPGFNMLAEHYSVVGDTVQKKKYLDLALQIARDAGNKALLDILKQKM